MAQLVALARACGDLHLDNVFKAAVGALLGLLHVAREGAKLAERCSDLLAQFFLARLARAALILHDSLALLSHLFLCATERRLGKDALVVLLAQRALDEQHALRLRAPVDQPLFAQRIDIGLELLLLQGIALQCAIFGGAQRARELGRALLHHCAHALLHLSLPGLDAFVQALHSTRHGVVRRLTSLTLLRELVRPEFDGLLHVCLPRAQDGKLLGRGGHRLALGVAQLVQVSLMRLHLGLQALAL